MRNLKTITKKDIELHAAKISDISSYVDRLLADGETTMESIQKSNYEKTKTFDYDVDENAETSESCGITCMPTFQFYKNGAKVDELQGANIDALKEKINTLK